MNRVKALLCRAIAACPPGAWPRLSALVRRLWPGFGRA